MIPTEILKQFNMVSLEEYKMMFGDSIETERIFYNTFLIQTDGIISLIVEKLLKSFEEATLLNISEVLFDFVKSVKEEYNDILQYRRESKIMLNKLKGE